MFGCGSSLGGLDMNSGSGQRVFVRQHVGKSGSRFEFRPVDPDLAESSIDELRIGRKRCASCGGGARCFRRRERGDAAVWRCGWVSSRPGYGHAGDDRRNRRGAKDSAHFPTPLGPSALRFKNRSYPVSARNNTIPRRCFRSAAAWRTRTSIASRETDVNPCGDGF